MDVDAAREAVLPELETVKARITGGDSALDGAFRIQLVDWFLHRVYEELDGPLDNAIAAIPPK